MNLILELNFFFLFNFLALATAFIWTVVLDKFKPVSFSEMAMSTALLFIFEIIFVETVLGIFGLLFYHFVFLFFVVIFLVTFLLFYKNLKVFWKTLFKKEQEFPWLPFLLLLALPFCVVFLQIFYATLRIPMDYDSVTYHLPIALDWLRTGDLKNIFYSPLVGPVSYYAANHQLLLLYFLMPFREDYIVTLINFPIYFLIAFALYQVCRNFKLSQVASIFAVSLFAGVPIVFILLGSQMVELSLCLTFLFALYFLQQYYLRGRNVDALLFGISGGLLIGIKQTGIIFFGPLFLAFIVILVIKSRGADWKKVFLKPFFIAAAFIFVAGCYWYIRNWIDIGYPLYPIQIDLFKNIGAPKAVVSTISSLFSSSLSQNISDWSKLYEFLFYFFKKMGAQLLIGFFVFLTAPAVTIASLYKKNFKDQILPIVLILTPALYFLLYWLTPYTGSDMTVLIHNMRFALVFLVTLVIATAYFLEKFNAPKWLYYFLSLGFFVYNFYYNYFKSPLNPLFNDFINLDPNLIKSNFGMFFGFVCLAAMVVITIIIFYGQKQQRWLKIGSVVIMLGIISLYFVYAVPKREELRIQNYPVWHQGDWHSLAWIDAAEWFNHYANNARIGLAGFPYTYPFYGRDLQRFVAYVNVNDCNSCKLSDYFKKNLNFRDHPDYQSWLKNLQANKIDYVVVEPSNENDAFEYGSITQHPETFEQVYSNQSAAIFKVL